MPKPTKYDRIITRIFERYHQGQESFEFPRTAIAEAAQELNEKVPSNLGDVIYTFRARRELPQSIKWAAEPDREWIIRSVGTSRYQFAQVRWSGVEPNQSLAETRIPNSTPALIELYKQSDEQALLAIIRYNRLVDIFTRLSCFSVQSHLKTSVEGVRSIEVDELYIGLDRRGAHFVLPVEVKSADDRLGAVQVLNMFSLAEEKFPELIARPLGAQFVQDDLVALFEFELDVFTREPRLAAEKHYRLVPAEDFSTDLLAQYRSSPED